MAIHPSRDMSLVTNPDQPLTSEYHRRPLRETPDSPLLVFIPGNPGLIDYYVTYLDIIAKRFPTFEVLAISHAGYQTTGDFVADGNAGEREFFDLDFQVQHKYDVIKRHIDGRRRDLYFLSHSVGGYILQRVLRLILQDKAMDVSVKFVGLICPTIVDIAKSQSGVFFTRLFAAPAIPITVWMVVLLHWVLPRFLALSIIRHILAKPVRSDALLLQAYENAVQTTYRLYELKRIVWQALTLAREELRVIHRDDDFNDWFFRELPQSGVYVWSFFAMLDYWVHDNTRDYILARYHDEQVPNLRFEVGEPDEMGVAIGHSFCIDQTVEFANITCEAFRRNKLA